jgi:predicted RNA-binding protein YlxR (DUF448 family)
MGAAEAPSPAAEPSTKPPPATLAQAARERRDLVSGEVMDEARLIRFVADPGGVVTPDLGRRLPGRGLWVAASRAAVDQAVRKGLFSRAAKRRLEAPPNLADLVEALLRNRILASLGLARKAGRLLLGFEKIRAALAAGEVAWLVEALDGAADGRDKLLALARHAPAGVGVLGVFSGEELSLALGAENVIHSALLGGRGADRWTGDVERLAGFRPLFPEAWRTGS